MESSLITGGAIRNINYEIIRYYTKYQAGYALKIQRKEEGDRE